MLDWVKGRLVTPNPKALQPAFQVFGGILAIPMWERLPVMSTVSSAVSSSMCLRFLTNPFPKQLIRNGLICIVLEPTWVTRWDFVFSPAVLVIIM